MTDEYGMLQDLVDDLWLEEREARVDAAQRKGRREGAIQAARKVMPVLARQEKKIAALINTLSSVESERRGDGFGLQAAQDDLRKAQAEIERLQVLVDQSGKWRRAHTALDDIRCAIIDAGVPLGDDSDPELTPFRLVQELLEEREKLRAKVEEAPAPDKQLTETRDQLKAALAEVTRLSALLTEQSDGCGQSAATPTAWSCVQADGQLSREEVAEHHEHGGMWVFSGEDHIGLWHLEPCHKDPGFFAVDMSRGDGYQIVQLPHEGVGRWHRCDPDGLPFVPPATEQT